MGEMVGSSSHQSYSALLDFLNKSYTLARVAQRSSVLLDNQEGSFQGWE